MADTDPEVALARLALTAPTTAPDPEVLGAVRTGLLAVPETGAEALPAASDDAPRLAVRRRTGY